MTANISKVYDLNIGQVIGNLNNIAVLKKDLLL